MSNKFATALKSKEGHNKPAASVEEQETSSAHKRPSRKGVKHVGGYFGPEVSKQLRQIALDEDSSVQALLGEAIDMLFHSRQKPTIAKSVDQ